jgi:HAMP domain-containing protein
MSAVSQDRVVVSPQAGLVRVAVAALVASVVLGVGLSLPADLAAGAGAVVVVIKVVALVLGLLGALGSAYASVVLLSPVLTTAGAALWPAAVVLLGTALGLVGALAFAPVAADGDGSHPVLGLVAAALAVLGVAAAIAWAVVQRRVARLARTARRVTETGRRTAAIVTAVQRLDGSGEAVRARLTVAFTDADGRDHHVTRTVTTADRLLPAVGGKLPLWYDPADPADLPSIVVGRSW